MIKRRIAAMAAGLVLLMNGAVTAAEQPIVMVDVEEGISAEELLQESAEAWEPMGSIPTDAAALNVSGKGAILMDQATGTILFEQDAHVRVPIASVTKVMTLLLIMEALDQGLITEDEQVSCSATAASMGGSQIWLEQGEIMTVDDLLKAIAVVSANDACAAMAEHLAGSIEEFVARMNLRAAELGMHDTMFLDCSGLNDEAYSCAYDVAVMSRELMKHEEIRKYTTIWMDTLRGGASQLVNTNKLVRHYTGATGLKTGTTQAAGHCLSATAERGGLALVAVILGSSTTDERFGGARKMLDYGFANYAVVTPSIDTSALTEVPVLHGVKKKVMPLVDAPQPLLMKKGQEKQLVSRIEMAENVEAPVEKGQILGRITVTLGEETVAEYKLRAAEEVEKLTVWRAFGRLLQAWS